MEKIIFILFILFFSKNSFAQIDPNTTVEQQLENLASANENEIEDDSYTQQLQYFRKHPIDLNVATASELKIFFFLTPMQIQNILLYRQFLGKLINIYELQAIPNWNIETIQKIRPYIIIGNSITIKEDFVKRFSQGENSLLARVSQVLEKSKGFTVEDTTNSKYIGSQQRVLIRYHYQYKNLLQYGLLAEKDAGEQLFKGQQKLGFDFYSVHLFAKDIGIIKHLALGDFTVNMGQGLVSWQTLAFRKSADIMGIKRQADVLKPYNSAGEFNFHRGIGITLKKKNWEGTAFVSYKKLSANIVSDTLNNEDYISSIQNAGYHRTEAEIEDKNRMKQFTVGCNFSYQTNRFHAGINAIHYTFSKPLQKGPEPYNIYAINGNTISNLSMDYSYTFRNTHLFGEVAADGQKDWAMVHGLMMSLDAKADFSLLYRNISRAYGSLYSNAFTENTVPINENGCYTGLEIRPTPSIRIDFYADMFAFPWLRYRVDRPSKGTDYLAQLTWKPNKQVEIYTRYTHQSKAINFSETNLLMHITDNSLRQNWRTNLSYKISSSFSLKSRVELLWIDKQKNNAKNGFLTFVDISYHPVLKPISATLRLQYFEADSYDSRLYAYENDVLYSFSIPSFFDKGYRYYININYNINKNLNIWFRLAQTIYPEKNTIGSGYDEINSSHKTEVKLQIMYRF